MTDPELKEKHRKRRQRNRLARELETKKYRQRIVERYRIEDEDEKRFRRFNDPETLGG